MTKTSPRQNKALVLEAFDTLFNKRDYDAASRFWSDKYTQHSAHIEPGREGLFGLVRSLPDSLRYEHGLILAEGDYVIVHGRFSGTGQPAAWVAADVVRIENGVLAEHWDVLQDEVTSRIQERIAHVRLPLSRMTQTGESRDRTAGFAVRSASAADHRVGSKRRGGRCCRMN